MLKKPRPFKIIRGLAVVRPNKFEYLDNDPLGDSRCLPLNALINHSKSVDDSQQIGEEDYSDYSAQDGADQKGGVTINVTLDRQGVEVPQQEELESAIENAENDA